MGILIKHLKGLEFPDKHSENEIKIKRKIENIISNSIMVMGLKEEGNQRWDRKRNIKEKYIFSLWVNY